MARRLTSRIDNRVVLPYDKAYVVVTVYCDDHCPVGAHLPSCLKPHLEERARMLHAGAGTYGVSDDCASGKHTPVCNGTGCDCTCYLKLSAVPSTVGTPGQQSELAAMEGQA